MNTSGQGLETGTQGRGTRRRWLTLGVAAAAGAIGAGVASWRFMPRSLDDDAVQQFWAARFESPEGAPVAMSAFRGRPLLLNFWATWCPPCVQELPLLNAFYGEHRSHGWQVLGLAIDQVASVRGFTARVPLDFPLAMGGVAGMTLVRGLGNPTGGLPFSVLLGPDGRVAQRKIGELTTNDLREWRASV